MSTINTYIAEQIADYNEICADILKKSKYEHYLLIGEMGAGKTTLIQSFCSILGSTDKVSSPTFSIVNEYLTSQKPIYHFDLYRLESFEALINIGIEDYIYQDAYCFIEWPELFLEMPVANYHRIEIEALDKSKRNVIFS